MKLKTILSILLALTFLGTQAQQATPDKLTTRKGPLTIQPILHGTVVFTWDNKTIYVDPYGGAKAFKGMAAPDMILITDIHGDHLDRATLDSIDVSKAVIIAPQAVADKLPEAMKAKTTVLANGERKDTLGISLTTVPMYNLPEAADALHPKGRGNGYLMQVGGKTIYLSGDTEDIPEMRALKNIDVAFVAMNLPYTMDVKQAASGVLAFKPTVVYPYHYRGQEGLSDVEAFKKLVNAGNTKIEVRLRNWYPAK